MLREDELVKQVIIEEILRRIDLRRQNLNRIAKQQGLRDPAVLAASQCLDRAIVEYQNYLQVGQLRPHVGFSDKRECFRAACKVVE